MLLVSWNVYSKVSDNIQTLYSWYKIWGVPRWILMEKKLSLDNDEKSLESASF